MILTKKIISKMIRCDALHKRLQILTNEVDELLENRGVDVYTLRQDDVGGYVDCVDYGRGLDIGLLENQVKKYIKKDSSKETMF